MSEEERHPYLKTLGYGVAAYAIMAIMGIVLGRLITMTADARRQKQTWMYPALAIMWLVLGLPIVATFTILGVGIVAMLGEIMYYPLFLGIAYSMKGDLLAAMGAFALGAFCCVAEAGFLYEKLGENNPKGKRWGPPLLFMGFVAIVTAGFFTVIGLDEGFTSALSYLGV